jgi:nitroreductase
MRIAPTVPAQRTRVTTLGRMNVIDAVNARMSVRQFTAEPVADEVLRSLVGDAAQAPSGGNVQPWRIYAVNGDSMVRMREFLATQPPLEEPEYDIYPKGLTEPYRTNRFECGEMMYATLGIAREDKDGRRRQFAHNNNFFDAPAAIFCYLDRQMGPPQWSDLGMYLQTFMLLAVERGLGTCAQEYWSVRHGAVSEFVGAPENEMLFCGMAVGHPDPDAPINTLRTNRMPTDQFARFL